MDEPGGDDPGATPRAPSRRSGRVPDAVVPGTLSLLVTVVLLAPLPEPVARAAVAVLVAALGVLAVTAVRSAWRSTLSGQVLWFWGVVTGLGHLLRTLVADPIGLQSAAIGAAVTVVWALGLALVRRMRRD